MEQEPDDLSTPPTDSEAGEADPSNDEMIKTLRELKQEWGIDFEESDIPHLQEMPPDEFIGYIFDALVEVGADDPVTVLQEKGILEPET